MGIAHNEAGGAAPESCNHLATLSPQWRYTMILTFSILQIGKSVVQKNELSCPRLSRTGRKSKERTSLDLVSPPTIKYDHKQGLWQQHLCQALAAQ